MNPWWMNTECIPTNSERINLHKDLLNHSHLNLDQVAAELRLLSKELDLQFVISGKILDSLHVLVRSVEER